MTLLGEEKVTGLNLLILGILQNRYSSNVGWENQVPEKSKQNTKQKILAKKYVRTYNFFAKPIILGNPKRPFYPLVGGHLTFPNRHLTIPKKSQRIARYMVGRKCPSFFCWEESITPFLGETLEDHSPYTSGLFETGRLDEWWFNWATKKSPLTFHHTGLLSWSPYSCVGCHP